MDLAGFFTESSDTVGKSDVQKMHDAIWIAKGAQEIATPPDAHVQTAEALGVTPENAAQMGREWSGKLRDLTGRMTSAESDHDTPDRLGLTRLIREFSPEESRVQKVGVTQDFLDRHGAGNPNEFTFSLKTLSADAETAEQQYAKLQQQAEVASKYFDHVAVERITDSATGKDTAIVVIRDHGQFLGAEAFNAVIAAEREKEGLTAKVQLAEEVAKGHEQALEKPTPIVNPDRMQELMAMFPSKGGSQHEEAALDPMKLRSPDTPAQGPDTGQGASRG